MFQTKVNGKPLELIKSDDSTLINGELFAWDIAKISEGYFHILHKNKSYRAEVVKADRAAKTFHLKINNVKAPMPGLVIDMKVKAGDVVKAGDPLLILEAMKMENILKAVAEATVKNVKVKKGDSVEKGQVLIEF